MDRVVRDGKVAVLYSPKYGAGWYSWNRDRIEILFDPAIVQLVIEEKFDELETFVELKYPEICKLGMMDLEVQWIPEGTLFKVVEYDGAESIEYKEDNEWIVA